MKIVRMRTVDGPNIYIYKPVLIMRLDLEAFTDVESYEVPGLTERLLGECPGLYDHYCAMGRPGGFVERLYGGTYVGHIVEHVALEFMARIGMQANFGKTRNAGPPNLYDVIVEFESEAAARFLLQVAVEFVEAAVYGRPYPLLDRIAQARRIEESTAFGPSTAALVRAARERQIPVRRIGEGSLLQLGTGRYRKLIQATLTHHTSAVATDIASDKALAKTMLDTAGIPVPRGSVALTLEDAERLFLELGQTAVIKPLDGCQGQGVTLHIRRVEDVRQAYEFARRNSRLGKVIVEEQAAGRQYRLLVVGDELVAAAERIPAHVVGDGAHSIRELIDIVNSHPDRGADHEKPLTRIYVDEAVVQCLARRGMTQNSVPLSGDIVYLRDGANLSTGGIAIDATDDLDPSYARLAVRAARAVGLDVCGIDVIAADIHIPVEQSGCKVIEINAAPGIRMHHFPSIGQPRDVAGAIIDSLFPGKARVRVPVISVTGTNGKTTTARMIGHILLQSGTTVGMTTTDGVYVDGQKVLSGDTTGPESARLVLSDPAVEAAVLETARGGIMRGGLAYDQADVGIITNVATDHIGQDGLRTVEDIVRVKSLVAECIAPGGVAVLCADDAELVRVAGRLQGQVVFVSVRDGNPVVRRHLARGGTAFFVQNGWLTEAAGALSWPIVRVEEIPATLQGIAQFHSANALCALAAARHMGVSRKRCANALRTFRSDTHNPGRVNLFRFPSGGHVVSDYGHNAEGVRAIGEMARRLSGRPCPAIIGFPGDRADEIVQEAARMAAQYFEPLFVKEDGDTRGRRRGEMAKLIVEAVRDVNPAARVYVELDECRALETAMDMYPAEPLLFMFHEKLDPVRRVLEDRGGVEVGSLQEEAVSPQVHAI